MTIASDLQHIASMVSRLGVLRNNLCNYLLNKGQNPALGSNFNTLIPLVNNLQPANYVNPVNYLQRMINNDSNILPSGTYATSTYYNLDYGVKIGYCPNGDILISMKGGTTTAYENLNFTLASAPAGVTITSSSSSWGTSNPAGQIYACLISGVTEKCNLSIDMNAINSSYDYTTCAITLMGV